VFHNVILLLITILISIITFVDMEIYWLKFLTMVMSYLFVIHIVIPTSTDEIILNKFIKYLYNEAHHSDEAEKYYQKLKEMRSREN